MCKDYESIVWRIPNSVGREVGKGKEKGLICTLFLNHWFL